MKSLMFIVLFLSLSVPAHAVELCDAQCTVRIGFPDGGSLYATETLTITFGDNGLINTGAGIIGYVAGNTLTLDQGESLEFGTGGSLDIGDAGNISYTHMELTTSGTIEIVALGEPEAITIETLIIIGAAELSLTGTTIDLNVLDMRDGSLNVDNPDGAGDSTGDLSCSITPGGGVTISNGFHPIAAEPIGPPCVWTALPVTFDGTFYLPQPALSAPEGVAEIGDGGSNSGSISFLYFPGLMLLFSLRYPRCRWG